MTKQLLNRRRVLRGMLNGTVVTVALPILDCFLDGNGQAFASGAPLPIRFGTWFWGLGMNSSIFIPKKTGPDYDLPEELKAISSVKQHVNVFTNFRVLTDGRPNLCHYSGWVGLRCGQAPAGRSQLPGPSIDVLVSDVIGGGTRFRALELAATGNQRHSYSFRSEDAINPPDISPVDFYTKIFGSEFQDPNSPHFTPDPKIMIRKSVLSPVMEDARDLKKVIGHKDQIRLDQYFTSLRELENRLALQLQKPPPAEACSIPQGTEENVPVGVDSELVAQRHKLMTDVLVMALACNQTRVFNMLYSDSGSDLTKQGHDQTHHGITHEEAIDEKLGYQVLNSWFVRKAMDEWAYFVTALASIREGDGTLLDRSLVFAHSDQEFAKVHSIDGIPMMTAGSAGGRIKTGIHVDGRGEAGTRVGLTVMRAAGVPMMEWGVGSMVAKRDVSEIIA